MTDPLSPETRRLLDLARDGLSPDAAAIRRMRAKVAVGTTAGTGLALKLVLALALTTAAGVGIALRRTSSPPPSEPRISLTSQPEVPVRVAAHEAAPSDESLIVLEPDEPAPPPHAGDARASRASATSDARSADSQATDARRVTSRDPARLATSPAGSAPTTPAADPPASTKPAASEPTATPITLAREVALVDAAMAALRHGDPSTALRAVHQHATETAGRGQLAEDAAAIEVEALCTLRDPAAAAKLSAFDAHYPRSAQRARLSTRCP